MLALHRVRSLLIREHTALINQTRGLLAEYGIVVAQGPARLRRALVIILEERDNGVSELLREMLVEMSERLRWLEERLKHYDLRIAALARSNEHAARLMKVEGVGPLIATAFVAAVGDARREKIDELGFTHLTRGHDEFAVLSAAEAADVCDPQIVRKVRQHHRGAPNVHQGCVGGRLRCILAQDPMLVVAEEP
jgi:hypothetical protein